MHVRQITFRMSQMSDFRFVFVAPLMYNYLYKQKESETNLCLQMYTQSNPF